VVCQACWSRRFQASAAILERVLGLTAKTNSICTKNNLYLEVEGDDNTAHDNAITVGTRTGSQKQQWHLQEGIRMTSQLSVPAIDVVS
jgi:hypothetical protein